MANFKNNIRNIFSICSSASIESFLVFCETRSFSSAANLLGTSQSNVSKLIGRLECALEVDLINRTTRPCTLTAEGMFLEKEFRNYLGSLEDALRRVRDRNNLKPTIRIGAVESISGSILPELAQEISKTFSEVVFKTSTSDVLVDDIQHRRIDVGIVSFNYDEIKGLERLFIFQEPSVLLLPKSFANKPTKTWDDLHFCGLPLITSRTDSGGGRLNEAYFSSILQNYPRKFSTDSNEVTVSLIRKGFGWALSRPSTIFQTKTPHGEILVRPMPRPQLNRRLYLIHREGEYVQECRNIQRICRNILCRDILPELVAIASWIRHDLRIVTEDGRGEKSFEDLQL